MSDHFNNAAWFAVSCRSRHEEAVALKFATSSIKHYLPMAREVHQWSDRRKSVCVPVFRGYLFVHIHPGMENKLAIVNTPGVVRFVGNQHGPVAIPDQQIEDVRSALLLDGSSLAPFLKQGDRVRVVRGALQGLEGLLVATSSSSRLIISIELIQRSIAINVSRQDVELIGFAPPLPAEHGYSQQV